jgi:hypothetical protein
LPTISGALALTARAATSAAPLQVSVTLFIGNDNAKGFAAIRSFVDGLGKPICAPQGILKGFHDREVVTLPEPFGRRAVFAFDSPEYDLFPALLGVRSVTVKVGFESRLVTATFLVLAMASAHGAETARLLARVGKWSRRGSSGAVWRTELFFVDGSTRRATLLARKDGQRIAALPCAMVAQALCSGTTRARGMLTACDFLGADALLDRLVAEGCELSTGNNS